VRGRSGVSDIVGRVEPSVQIRYVEKPDGRGSEIGAIRAGVFTPEIFECLEHTTPGVGGEVQLTDGIRILLQFQEIYAHAFQGKRYDTGDKAGYIEAIIDFALANPETCDDVAGHLASLGKPRSEVFPGGKLASGTTADSSEIREREICQRCQREGGVIGSCSEVAQE
jgi:UTP-glucose-1-phosphate uridylyltransferase